MLSLPPGPFPWAGRDGAQSKMNLNLYLNLNLNLNLNSLFEGSLFF